MLSIVILIFTVQPLQDVIAQITGKRRRRRDTDMRDYTQEERVVLQAVEGGGTEVNIVGGDVHEYVRRRGEKDRSFNNVFN